MAHHVHEMDNLNNTTFSYLQIFVTEAASDKTENRPGGNAIFVPFLKV